MWVTLLVNGSYSLDTSNCLLFRRPPYRSLNSNSKLTMIGGTVVGGILLLLILGQWNSVPLPISDDSVVQTVTEEEVSDANAAAESIETSESPSSASNVIQETTTAPVSDHQTTESDSPAVLTETGASTTSDGSDSVIPQTASSGSTSITYSSGGHGHGSSHSSSNNADSVADQGVSGDGGVSSNPTEEQNGGTSDDESFFVLPESPIGSVLILASSLAAMGGFLAFRAKNGF